VAVQNGTFSVMLGSITSLDPNFFSQQLYLALAIDGGPEMSPRSALSSVPSAFVSNAVSGTGDVVTSGVVDALGQSSKVRFHYNDATELPSAATYHGMFAHAHNQGKAYFAHDGAWVPLAPEVHVHSSLAESDGPPNPALSVDTSGNVGIGTPSPTARLDIAWHSGCGRHPLSRRNTSDDCCNRWRRVSSADWWNHDWTNY
jgi:hypothetical protein